MNNDSMKVFKLLGLLLVFLVINETRAEDLTLEITDGVDSTIPLAVVPFGWTGNSVDAPIDAAAVVKSDLSRTGYFTLVAEQNMLTKPTLIEQVKFRNWQALGQEYLAIGMINEAQGQYIIEVQLFDVFKEEQIISYRINASPRQLRQAMHRISDLIFEKLTGVSGVFGSKVAYITKTKAANKQSLYKLQVADADGFNPITIAASSEPLMSPVWSPDGKKIAYVSFENKASAIFVQTLASGERSKVSAYPGINGAPAWSPDGRRMAITLSKDGSPDIYILNLGDRSLLKLTQNLAIDTEATWSPDGRFIVFTSDRGGKPQLYKIPSQGGRAERLTFQGSYNARGRFSKDGKQLAMVHGNGGNYRIAVMDMANKAVSILTPGRLDESPSFAPNSSMLIYAAQQGNQRILSMVTVDGAIQQKLAFGQGQVREAAWSP